MIHIVLCWIISFSFCGHLGVVLCGRVDIAYGGILNVTTAIEDCSASAALKPVIRFAIKYARRRWPVTIPTNERDRIAANYVAGNCSMLELVYSHDGVEPSLFQMQHPMYAGRVIQSPLYWGVTYRFHISWPDSPYHHGFVITEYEEKLFVYQHTFHPSVQAEELKAADADEDLQPNLCVQSASNLYTGADQFCQSTWYSVFTPLQTQICPLTCYHKETDRTYLNKENKCSSQTCSSIPDLKPEYIAAQKFSRSAQDIIRSRNGVLVQLGQNRTIDFRILTFNIWNTNTVQQDNRKAVLYGERLQHIVKLCESADADIIAFQEVRFEDGRGGKLGPNQVQHLASLLPGYQFVYEPAQIQEHGIPRRIEEGLAIFSRYPIVSHRAILLSRNAADVADTHQRILLDATIEVPVIGHIHVMTTHLSLSHVARQRTVVEMWSYIRHITAPVFLTGDFNAEAHNDEVKFLSGSVSLHGIITSGLHDLWLRHHGTRYKGFTFNTLEQELSKRIDLIFMKAHESVICESIEIVDNGLRREKAASDHLGLLASFTGISNRPTS